MPDFRRPLSAPAKLDALRTEFADLAFDLERRGRRDAADVVMMLDLRVRELAQQIAAEYAGDEAIRVQSAGPVENSP